MDELEKLVKLRDVLVELLTAQGFVVAHLGIVPGVSGGPHGIDLMLEVGEVPNETDKAFQDIIEAEQDLEKQQIHEQKAKATVSEWIERKGSL